MELVEYPSDKSMSVPWLHQFILKVFPFERREGAGEAVQVLGTKEEFSVWTCGVQTL